MPWGRGMATDRDEQQREQQRQELEEIRRSFAEMGARMGSLFEPAEADESEPAQQAALGTLRDPATPGTRGLPGTASLVVGGPAGAAVRRRHRVRLAPAPGWGRSGGGAPSPGDDGHHRTPGVRDPAHRSRPHGGERVPVCGRSRAGRRGHSRLNRNDRDNRLALARGYIASQACRREASPDG